MNRSKSMCGTVSLIMVSTMLLGASLYSADTPPKNEDVIFSDDFEAGFSPEWAQHESGIAVVPEDPNNPKGNHVARFTKGQTFLGTTIKHGDWKTAKAEEEKIKKDWRNYELSFRWRIGADLGKWDKITSKASQLCFFDVFWRRHPLEDNPWICNLVKVAAAKDDRDWCVIGPRTCWEGVISDFEQKNIEQDARKGGERKLSGKSADNQWHTFKLVVEGKRSSLYWDGQLYFVGTDDRTSDGGIQIWSGWNDEFPLDYLDVDDVLVKRISGDGVSGN